MNIANDAVQDSVRLTHPGWTDIGAPGDGAGPAVSLSVAVSNTQGTARVTARARRRIEPPAELLVYRVRLKEWQRRLGGTGLTMLVNSENVNNGTSGLARFPFEAPFTAEPPPSSHWYTVLGSPATSRYALLGFLPPIRHRTFLRVRRGWLECGCLLQRVLRKGEVFSSDDWVIRTGDNPHDLLEAFGDDCARRLPPRPSRAVGVGWNSWDYYFTDFEEHDLREQLAALRRANRTLPSPVRTVVLDMGWFNDFGDWRANGRFPSGMAAVAASIRAKGFTPGIWLAPLHVSCLSHIGLRTPELCATNPQGQIVGDEFGAGWVFWMDPTHPKGRAFLVETFRRLRKAGFTYFKLDFLHSLITHAQAHRRRFHRDSRGRMEILRDALEAVREGAGADAFLLACGCPPEAAAGITDACRIGGDISTYHSTTKVQARALATRYWMHGRLFMSDPDFLMVRGDATARDRHHNPCHPANLADAAGSRSGATWRTQNEPRVWATLTAMSGGLLMLADHLGKLNATGMRMLSTAIRHATTEAARPLDLMENPLPRWWLREGSQPALAVINWEDRPVDLRIPVDRWPALRAFLGQADVWRHRRIKPDGRSWKLHIPAHDVAWFVQDPERGSRPMCKIVKTGG